MGCFVLQSLMDYHIDSNSVDSKSAPIPSWLVNFSLWTDDVLIEGSGFLHRYAHSLPIQWMELMENKREELERVDQRGNCVCFYVQSISFYLEMTTQLDHINIVVDHGLDSWSTVPFTITIFSVFGQGVFRWVPPPFPSLLSSYLPFQCFSSSSSNDSSISADSLHCYSLGEIQYGSSLSLLGIRCIPICEYPFPPSFNLLHLKGLAIVYAFTFIVGFEWYKFYVFGGFTFADCFEIGFYCECI